MISINEFKNKNNIIFYEVKANVLGGYEVRKYYLHSDYYLQYSKLPDINFIKITGNDDLKNQIISSLNFLE
ncbi:MAG: hypothetical protein PHT51_05175 [Patescibacteria group bacterium]|nr:hypothetical protein [Patescibacteria group bacterium]MDD4611212.1 hypothetical protein [Patescibacteria group bacterium]